MATQILFKNLLLAPVILNVVNLPRSVHGETYTIKSSDGTGRYICPGSSSDQCDIYCDVQKRTNPNHFSCGNVDECHLYCQNTKCFASATLNATAANNLYVHVTGKQCMLESTVFTPANGNATFTIANWGSSYMNINAGANAQNLIIDCESSCKWMNIDAKTTNYLEVTIAKDKSFVDSNIQCPVDSNYNGPNEASCIVDPSNEGSINNLTLITKQGYPKDAWVRYQGADTISALTFVCDKGADTYPSPGEKECFNTNSPTIHTTTSSTKQPSLDPTPNPSFVPTKGPSLFPTLPPTLHPTTSNPTGSPTKSPSKTPTTPSPTLYAQNPVFTPSPTLNEAIVIEVTDTTSNDAMVTEQKQSPSQHPLVTVRLDAVILFVSITVLMCLLVVLLLYWRRKDKYYKAGPLDKKVSLMQSGEQNGIQMHIFENNPYNNLMVGNAAAKQTASWNSDDACMLSGSPLYDPNTVQMSLGEHVASLDEEMSGSELDIMDEINREYTKGEAVSYVDEGVKNNDVNALEISDVDDINIIDDMDIDEECSIGVQTSQENIMNHNDPENDPEIIGSDETITKGANE
eukprot:1010347_1